MRTSIWVAGCFRREREALSAVDEAADQTSARLRWERASTARWVASLFEPRHVEISSNNVALFEQHLALVDAGEAPPADTDPQVDGIVEAIDGVVAAAAYMAAETVGAPGANYGHWVGRTLGEGSPATGCASQRCASSGIGSR